MSKDTTTVLWTYSAMSRYKVIKLQTGKCEGGIAGWVLTSRDDSSLESRIKAEPSKHRRKEEKKRQPRERSHADIARTINKARALVGVLAL